MSRKADPTKSKQYRIEHGLCPMCGKESAPYYLCHDHRNIGALHRLLTKMVDQRLLTKTKDGRAYGYEINHASGKTPRDFVPGRASWLDLKPDDKRRRPRLGRRPVDLDETLIGIFQEAARPLTIEEVVSAWGRLRSQRKHETLAGDMAAIIKAQRKRDERAARWRETLARSHAIDTSISGPLP